MASSIRHTAHAGSWRLISWTKSAKQKGADWECLALLNSQNLPSLNIYSSKSISFHPAQTFTNKRTAFKFLWHIGEQIVDGFVHWQRFLVMRSQVMLVRKTLISCVLLKINTVFLKRKQKKNKNECQTRKNICKTYFYQELLFKRSKRKLHSEQCKNQQPKYMAD